jgi:hypothetical protein
MTTTRTDGGHFTCRTFACMLIGTWEVLLGIVRALKYVYFGLSWHGFELNIDSNWRV